MILNKAEIKQQLSVSDEALEALKDHDGPIYISINNSGDINNQVNQQNNNVSLTRALYEFYEKGIGLLAMMERVKRMYVEFAIADCQSYRKAAARLKVAPHTLEYHFWDKKNKNPAEYPKEKGPGD